MFKFSIFIVIFFTLPTFAQDTTSATQLADGVVKKVGQDKLQAWDATANNWVTLEQFWLNFAKREGGLTWGRSATYPEYDKVNEFDTFMVETAKGPCLMQFFHSRWRRANDVQRWDEAFNEYKGCPYVFD